MKSYKKMGLLFLALVIALAGVGVGFAAWTDSITIEGTVNTGSVELEVFEYSGIIVNKVPGGGPNPPWGSEISVEFWHKGNETIPDTSDALSWSGARPGGPGEADVVAEWWNIFPSIDFESDVHIRYVGSIPAKVVGINYVITEGAEWLQPLIDNGNITAGARIVYSDDQSRMWDEVGPGYQLHYNDVVYLRATIHLPQDNTLMNKTGAFEASFDVIQWNEYEPG